MLVLLMLVVKLVLVLLVMILYEVIVHHWMMVLKVMVMVAEQIHLNRSITSVLESFGEWIVFNLQFCHLMTQIVRISRGFD